MLISDFAIKRPTVTVVTMLALVVFGTFALLALKTDDEIEKIWGGNLLPHCRCSPSLPRRSVFTCCTTS